MQKNWTIPQFLALAFLPVIAIELCLLPFWFATEAVRQWVTTTQLFLTGLLLPLYLVVIGRRFIWSGTIRHALLALTIPIPAILLALFLDYLSWGVWSGMFWHPDYETVIILWGVGQFALAIALIPLVLTTIFRYARPNPH